MKNKEENSTRLKQALADCKDARRERVLTRLEELTRTEGGALLSELADYASIRRATALTHLLRFANKGLAEEVRKTPTLTLWRYKEAEGGSSQGD